LFIDLTLEGMLSEVLNAGLFYYKGFDHNKKYH